MCEKLCGSNILTWSEKNLGNKQREQPFSKTETCTPRSFARSSCTCGGGSHSWWSAGRPPQTSSASRCPTRAGRTRAGRITSRYPWSRGVLNMFDEDDTARDNKMRASFLSWVHTRLDQDEENVSFVVPYLMPQNVRVLVSCVLVCIYIYTYIMRIQFCACMEHVCCVKRASWRDLIIKMQGRKKSLFRLHSFCSTNACRVFWRCIRACILWYMCVRAYRICLPTYVPAQNLRGAQHLQFPVTCRCPTCRKKVAAKEIIAIYVWSLGRTYVRECASLYKRQCLCVCVYVYVRRL